MEDVVPDEGSRWFTETTVPSQDSLPDLNNVSAIDTQNIKQYSSIEDLSDNGNIENINANTNVFAFEKEQISKDSVNSSFIENIAAYHDTKVKVYDVIEKEIESHYDTLPKRDKISYLPDLISNRNEKSVKNDVNDKFDDKPFTVYKSTLSDALVNTRNNQTRNSDVNISSSSVSSESSCFVFPRVFVDERGGLKKNHNEKMVKYYSENRDSIEDYSYFDINNENISSNNLTPRSSPVNSVIHNNDQKDSDSHNNDQKDSGIQNNDQKDSEILSESIFLTINSKENSNHINQTHVNNADGFLLPNFESETQSNDDNKIQSSDSNKNDSIQEDVIYATAEIHAPKIALLVSNIKNSLVTEKQKKIANKNKRSSFLLLKKGLPDSKNSFELNKINDRNIDSLSSSSDEEIFTEFNSKADFEHFKADSSSEESENEIKPDEITLNKLQPVLENDDDSPPPLPPRGYLIPKSNFQRQELDISYMRLKTNEQYKYETSRNTYYTSFASLFQAKTYERIQTTEERLRLIRKVLFCQSYIDDDENNLLQHMTTLKPTFARNVDVTIHHSESVCKIIENIELEIFLTLEVGYLKYGINGQELEVDNIINISAEKIRRDSKWSHAFEVTWCDLNAMNVLRIATRGELERDTWLQRILECATTVFPRSLTNNFSRAGWLSMKEDECDAWTACWMLVNDVSVHYSVRPDEIVEMKLESVRYVVLQRMNNDIKDYLHITIDFTDRILYLQGISAEDTKQWEQCLRMSSKIDVKNASEVPEGTVYEEILELENIRPPAVPFRPHGTKPEGEYRDCYDNVDDNDSITKLENKIEISNNRDNSNNMFITVHVGMFPSPVVTQVAIGPDTKAGEVQKIFGNTDNLRLQEYVLNGTLKRPLLAGEKILSGLLRWGQWDERDARKNQLVLSECSFYLRARNLGKKKNYTACGEVRFADTTNKSRFKSYWMEYSLSKLRLYRHQMSSEILSEWNVNELLWFVGHEANRNPNTPWSITFIQKENKTKRSQKVPYFGYTMGGTDNEEFVLWCAAFMTATE